MFQLPFVRSFTRQTDMCVYGGPLIVQLVILQFMLNVSIRVFILLKKKKNTVQHEKLVICFNFTVLL